MRNQRNLTAPIRPAHDQFEQCFDLLNAYAATVLTERILAEVTDGGLTPAQLDALTYIHRHGGCSAKALAEGLHISIPSSTRLVDRLERKALVDRRESSVDRRLVILTVTPEGEDALATIRAGRVARLQQALETFTPADREHFTALLERLVLAVLRDEQTVNDCCLHCGSEHENSCMANQAHLALVGRPIERT